MNSLHGHFSDSPTRGLWQSLNLFVGLLIIATVSVIVVYRYHPDLSKLRELDAHKEALKAEIDQQRQMLARNTRAEYLLINDPEYAGLIARDRLNLMKPDEIVFRMEPPRPDPAKMRLNP
jgi:cell division protein FtsB